MILYPCAEYKCVAQRGRNIFRAEFLIKNKNYTQRDLIGISEEEYNHKFLATLDNMYQGYYISGYERKRSNRDIEDFKVNSEEVKEICSQIEF